MPCSVCNRDIRIAAKGLCGACYQRLQKRGTTEYAPKRVRGRCSIEGCERESVAREMCYKHWERWKTTGDPTQTKRPDDWGAKTGHPLYNRWSHMMRYRTSHPVCEQWQDFLQFAMDIGGPPEPAAKLFAADETKPIGPDNFVWKLAVTQRVEGEDEATFNRRRDRAYRHIQRERQVHYDLKKHYGLSKDDVEAMYSAQKGKCAICDKEETQMIRGKVFRLAVDHCHTSGRVRGLLCRKCNSGLGSFRDDPELLKKAIIYLGGATSS